MESLSGSALVRVVAEHLDNPGEAQDHLKNNIRSLKQAVENNWLLRSERPDEVERSVD